ncbi:FMN-dependent NADH-azoreductase [Paenibacillus sacheonensis]|uniref:FMN dependent NADH:quinone oxidoreductase n=1 Tax=Paenibacillus sacheonensis TaxID=742054 RepID=A0A7X4YQ55_9BACL|nr:NAD(P)H-dependent oxidoreductase [Paenibacillus sacheonensis]MBM7566261.1 FMN-dependent NADH-azoreductase [Paenibacillus sacheonensis]NBC70468.1 FMN-dependent NADH-azoreductase [Paenibacillus sacheonensis]
MEKLLVINAHAAVDSPTSVSLEVGNHFIENYRKLNPNGAIEQIDLYAEEIPEIDSTVLSAWNKFASGGELTDEEKRVTGRMNEILQQFKSAKKYVIVMPLHNFNISSRLKDYMDNILIARETFKYTENGSVGLLTDGRSLLVIQGSGGVYTNDDWYTDNEFSHKYLKSMFNFLGIEDYQIIRAQGTSVLDKAVVLDKAKQEAQEAAARLVNTVTV